MEFIKTINKLELKFNNSKIRFFINLNKNISNQNITSTLNEAFELISYEVDIDKIKKFNLVFKPMDDTFINKFIEEGSYNYITSTIFVNNLKIEVLIHEFFHHYEKCFMKNENFNILYKKLIDTLKNEKTLNIIQNKKFSYNVKPLKDNIENFDSLVEEFLNKNIVSYLVDDSEIFARICTCYILYKHNKLKYIEFIKENSMLSFSKNELEIVQPLIKEIFELTNC